MCGYKTFKVASSTCRIYGIVKWGSHNNKLLLLIVKPFKCVKILQIFIILEWHQIHSAIAGLFHAPLEGTRVNEDPNPKILRTRKAVGAPSLLKAGKKVMEDSAVAINIWAPSASVLRAWFHGEAHGRSQPKHMPPPPSKSLECRPKESRGREQLTWFCPFLSFRQQLIGPSLFSRSAHVSLWKTRFHVIYHREIRRKDKIIFSLPSSPPVYTHV